MLLKVPKCPNVSGLCLHQWNVRYELSRASCYLILNLKVGWKNVKVICSYNVTGTDFEKSLHVFGQSEKI